MIRKSLSRKVCPVEIYLMQKRREDTGHPEQGNSRQRAKASGWSLEPDEPQKRDQWHVHTW